MELCCHLLDHDDSTLIKSFYFVFVQLNKLKHIKINSSAFIPSFKILEQTSIEYFLI